MSDILGDGGSVCSSEKPTKVRRRLYLLWALKNGQEVKDRHAGRREQEYHEKMLGGGNGTMGGWGGAWKGWRLSWGYGVVRELGLRTC